MIKEIRAQLIELARSKRPWSYSQLNSQLQLGLNFNSAYDRDLIGEWLGEVSLHEFQKGRPLLSALIIHKSQDREQGDGFYKLCGELYNKDWKKLKEDKDFELNEMKECYSYWKDSDNYKQFKNDY